MLYVWYVVCMVWYMYVHITFECDSHIDSICRKHTGLNP